MIWKSCDLQKRTNRQPDALGNMTGGDWEIVKATLARRTPWSTLGTDLDGRTVTRNEQWFLLPVPFAELPECTHAVIDGVRQEITELVDLTPRYTAVRVEVHKK